MPGIEEDIEPTPGRGNYGANDVRVEAGRIVATPGTSTPGAPAPVGTQDGVHPGGLQGAFNAVVNELFDDGQVIKQFGTDLVKDVTQGGEYQ